MNIPFFPYNKAFIKYKSEFGLALNEIIFNGQYIFGDQLTEFEQNIATYTNSKYCIGIANATDGLEMMMQYIKLKNTDEVILSSHTMIATLSAIVHSNSVN